MMTIVFNDDQDQRKNSYANNLHGPKTAKSEPSARLDDIKIELVVI
jgi:hypothetical protein